ncbi:MAG: branched-chain amino acid ABC transporter permease [Thermoleophilia bacterium]|nr:branched-chain amino acid ABC transporter permease [Thermoleophilia bacterium]
MDQVIQNVINALSLGGIYALLALGLAIVYSILQLINFAHGALLTTAGYAMYFAISAGMPFAVAVILAIVASTVAAMLMERIGFRPLRGANFAILILSSYAINLIMVTMFQVFISARAKSVNVPSWIEGSLQLGGVQVGVVDLVTIGATVVALVSLVVFFQKTKGGISIRAAAADFDIARLMGIRANVVIAGAFGLSGLLAGVAGVLLVAKRGSVDPHLGDIPVIKAFIAATIGGLGSLPGAVAGGFFLGAVEICLQATLPDALQAYRDAFVLSLVILVPLIRPGGLVRAQEPEGASA